VLFVEELDPIIEVQDTTQAPQSGGGQATPSGGASSSGTTQASS